MASRLLQAAQILERAVGLHQAGRSKEAETEYRRVLTLDPACADALGLLGLIRSEHGEHDMAERLLRAAIAIEPAPRFWHNLAAVLEKAGDISGCISAFRQAAFMAPDDVFSAGAAIFNTDLHPQISPAVRLADRRDFNAKHCAALTKAAQPHSNDRDPCRRLRIGYISADFQDHSAALVFGPVFAGHHREAVEITCYWQKRAEPDVFTRHFQERADRWRVVNDLSDAALARQIRADEIDILVDLSGYSNGHRITTLARKPAPIIMTAWGHVTGLGIDASDYILADAVTVPPEHEHQYHERILRLPCLMAFDPTPDVPAISQPPSERNGYVTFGYLGRALKMNDVVWAAWADILRRVPNSRLLLKGSEYQDDRWQRRIHEFFGSLRVEPRRIVFQGKTKRRQHLDAYGSVDIALDPFPHNGGVTTLEATLMGVPNVALLGQDLNSRITASVLNVLGRQEWVGLDLQHYVDIAVALAAKSPTLEDRQQLRADLLGSVICDADKYATAVEDLYRTAWQSWVAGEHVGAPRLSLVSA